MRVLVINVALLIVIWMASELLFRLDDNLNFLPKTEVPLSSQNWNHEKQVALKELGESVLQPLPRKYEYMPDPRLKNFHRDDTAIILPENPIDNYAEHTTVRAQKRVVGRDLLVYDVNYVKEYGKRVVENQVHKKNAKNFIFTFGCSFTMGEGVSQGFDYPSQLAEKLDDNWKVYNFGNSGYGPNSLLADFQRNPKKFQGIPETSGAFVWMMIPDHVMRLTCPWSCYQKSFDWLLSQPEVVFENDRFVVKDAYLKSDSWKRKIYYWLSRSSAVQHLAFPPVSYSFEDLDLFVKSLNQIVSGLKNFGKSINKKYIIIYQYFDGYETLKDLLVKSDFEPIEYFRIADLVTVKGALIPLDYHPSSATYWYVSEVLKNRVTASTNRVDFTSR